jgi:hypothetical protein
MGGATSSISYNGKEIDDEDIEECTCIKPSINYFIKVIKRTTIYKCWCWRTKDNLYVGRRGYCIKCKKWVTESSGLRRNSLGHRVIIFPNF